MEVSIDLWNDLVTLPGPVAIMSKLFQEVLKNKWIKI